MTRIVGLDDARGKDRVQTVNDEPSETVQSDAHLADINTVLQTFMRDGIEALDHADLMYKDVSEFTDLADALNQARDAEVEFMKLHPKVRAIFENDVANWLDTAHDVEKRDALVEAGFLKREKVAEQGGGGGGSGSPDSTDSPALEGGAPEPAPAAPAPTTP